MWEIGSDPIFSGRFDTSGSMIALLVPEISPGVGFCDEHEEDKEELGILVVRLCFCNN